MLLLYSLLYGDLYCTEVQFKFKLILFLLGYISEGEKKTYIYSLELKGAVCKFLTLLKHKNTIICLQIFKKHAKLTYLFI